MALTAASSSVPVSAATRGDWQNASISWWRRTPTRVLAPADLPVLGEVAYAAGDLDVAIEAWERAHAACIQADDQSRPRVRPFEWRCTGFDTALMAPVRGWLARAERLLEGVAETPAHAWFAVVRAYERMLTGDVPGRSPLGPPCDRGGFDE